MCDQRVCRNPHCDNPLDRNARRGLCGACNMFQRRHGRLRTQDDMRLPLNAGTCRNCHRAPAQATGRCYTCYRYRQRNGRERPRKLYARPERCRNCGKPRDSLPYLDKGRCNACRKYWKRHGVERPPELINAPLGYCDCGHKATRTLDLTFTTGTGLKVTDTYHLCDDCYQLEIEP